MSYTELHTGKLKPIEYNLSIEDFKKWLENKDGFEVEDFEEYVEEEYEFFQVLDKTKKYKDSMYIKYVYNKGTLYEMLQYSGEMESEFSDKTNVNEDRSIDFTYLFQDLKKHF